MAGLPLEGIRCLEVSRGIPAAYAGLILAELGARVIKVEDPGHGDPLREVPPIFEGGHSLAHLTYNRLKESITLHLAHPHGRSVFGNLLRHTDVLIHSLPKPLRVVLGITRDAMAEVRPEMIVCSVTPFGDTGPYAGAGGADLVLEAVAGSLGSDQGNPDPTRTTAPSVAELAAGLNAALGVTTALLKRIAEEGEEEEPGEEAEPTPRRGAWIEVAGLESLVHFSAYGVQEALLGHVKKEVELPSARRAPAGVFRTKDRPIALVSQNEQAWHQICDAIEAPELVDDPRFHTIEDRIDNQQALTDLMEAKLAARTAEEWIADLRDRGIPVGPVNRPGDVANDPHLLARDSVGKFAHGTLGEVPGVRSPIRFRGVAPRSGKAAPALGEHNTEVYMELLGYRETELKRLRSEKVI